MIERTVLVKLKEAFTTAQKRLEVADHSQRVLAAVPGVTAVRVGVAAEDRTSACWDLVITVRFASLEHVPAYAAHPVHRAYVDEYLRPRLETLKAWNFETVRVESTG